VVLQTENQGGFSIPTPTTVTGSDGTFLFTDVPQVATYDIRIIVSGFATVLFDNVFVPGGSSVDLSTMTPTSGGVLIGGQGIGPFPSVLNPVGDTDGPFLVSASITPNQDVAKANQAQNITLRVNEALSEHNLDSIRLTRLGFKGGEIPIASQVFPDVLIARSLSSDKKSLIIDIDPGNDPNTPLESGRVYAVIGFDGLSDASNNPFDTLNANNFIPSVPEPFSDYNGNGRCDPFEPFVDLNSNGRCDGFMVLRFTTNAEATLLALSGVPVQVPNSAQNTAPSFSATPSNLDLEFGAQAPGGARAYRVYASPGSLVTDPSLLCRVLETSFGEVPPTALSISLSTIDFALRQCNRPIAYNTRWDDGLRIDAAISVINADGEEGPLSAILTAKDNVSPRIYPPVPNPYSPPPSAWGAGAQPGDFLVRIFFTEQMDEDALTNLANYQVISADGDTYSITTATIPPDADPGNPASVDLSFTLESTAPPLGIFSEQEPNNVSNTANPVSLPTRISGYISSPDSDLFSLAGTLGQNIRVMLIPSSGCCASQPQVALLDINGAVLAHTTGSGSTMGTLGTTLPGDGTFFVRVMDASPFCCSSFNYTLYITSGTDGLVSSGDRIVLGNGILDEAGNSIAEDADTLTVTGATVVVDGGP